MFTLPLSFCAPVTRRFLAILITSAVVVGLLPLTPAHAVTKTWYVSTDTAKTPLGVDGTSCTSPSYVGANDTTISEAVAGAAVDDTIHLCSGEYLFSAEITIEKSLTIEGDSASATILDAQSNTTGTGTRFFNLPGEANYTLTVKSMRLQNGTGRFGGAIFLDQNANLVVDAVHFKNNKTINTTEGGKEHGGSIHANGGSSGTLTVSNSFFELGSAVDGGAMELMGGGSKTVTNSTFYSNTAARDGGAIGISMVWGNIRIRSNTFVNNRAPNGGAIRVSDGTTLLEGNLLADDNADGGSTGVCNQEETNAFLGVGNVATDETCNGSIQSYTDEVTGRPAHRLTSYSIDGAKAKVVPFADLRLGSLVTDESPVPFFRPSSTSAAIDTWSGATCPSTDVRGTSRTGGDGCDAGAVEVSATLTNAPSITASIAGTPTTEPRFLAVGGESVALTPTNFSTPVAVAASESRLFVEFNGASSFYYGPGGLAAITVGEDGKVNFTTAAMTPGRYAMQLRIYASASSRTTPSEEATLYVWVKGVSATNGDSLSPVGGFDLAVSMHGFGSFPSNPATVLAAEVKQGATTKISFTDADITRTKVAINATDISIAFPSGASALLPGDYTLVISVKDGETVVESASTSIHVDDLVLPAKIGAGVEVTGKAFDFPDLLTASNLRVVFEKGATSVTVSSITVLDGDEFKFTTPQVAAGIWDVQLQIRSDSGSVVDFVKVKTTVIPSPTINTQPQSTFGALGTSITLSVDVATIDGQSVTYQWIKDGTDIPDAVGSSFVIDALATADIGAYRVRLTNTQDDITAVRLSSVANVGVGAQTPTITSQPVGGAFQTGSEVTLSVSIGAISDGGTLSYQWLKGGVEISGATSSQLKFTSFAAANVGSYSVRVTNAFDAENRSSVTSDAVQVTLAPPTNRGSGSKVTSHANSDIGMFPLVSHNPRSGQTLVAWRYWEDPKYYVMAALIDQQGKVIGTPLEVSSISTRTGWSLQLAAGPSGEWILSWERGSSANISARVVKVVDGALALKSTDEPVTINATGRTGLYSHAIAWGAEEQMYLAAWASDDGVFARVLDPNGIARSDEVKLNVPVDGDPQFTNGRPMDLADSADGWIAVWNSGGSSPSKILGRLISWNPSTYVVSLGSVIDISGADTVDPSSPSITRSGGTMTVVYRHDTGVDGPDRWSVRARKLTAAGMPTGTTFTLGTYSVPTSRPRVASSGTDSRFVWTTEHSPGPWRTATRAVQVTLSASGTVGPITNVFKSTFTQARPSITYSSELGDYVVAWAQTDTNSKADIWTSLAPPLTAPNLTGGPATFTISPTLPTGLAIDDVTGTISGTPGAAGFAPKEFVVTATNELGTSSLSLTLRSNSSSGCSLDVFKIWPGRTGLRTDAINDTGCHARSLTLPVGGQTLSARVNFPTGALSAPTSFAIASTSTAADLLAGRSMVQVTAQDEFGNDVRSFLKPVAIELTGSASLIASVSTNGVTWRTLNLLTAVPTTVEDLGATGDGYMVGTAVDGVATFTIYTSHLTSFGLRQSQATVSLVASTTTQSVGGRVTLTASGGSTTTSFTYSTSTTDICSVSVAGVVTVSAIGTCTVTATRPGDANYLDESSSPVSITVRAAAAETVTPPMIPAGSPMISGSLKPSEAVTCTAPKYSQEIQSATFILRIAGVTLLRIVVDSGPFVAKATLPDDAAGKLLECEVQGYANNALGTVVGEVRVPAKVTSTPTPTPTPTATPTPTPTKQPVVTPTVKKTTITCVKGKVKKKVTGVKPKCPKGYKRR